MGKFAENSRDAVRSKLYQKPRFQIFFCKLPLVELIFLDWNLELVRILLKTS